jgi:hypothetical protein
MSGAVYLVCAATSLTCAVLLFRAYRRNRIHLLFWSACCFVGKTLDNVLMFVDDVVVPHIDLSDWRHLPALVGVALLIYGMVWDAK